MTESANPPSRPDEVAQGGNALLDKLIEDAPIAIIVANARGEYIYRNPALEQMLGYSNEEFLQIGIAGITHPDDFMEDARLYGELWAGQRDRYQLEKRYIHKDGRVVWGLLTATIVRDAQGQNQYVIGMIEDITAHKQSQEALQRAQENFQQLMQNTADLMKVVTGERYAGPPAGQVRVYRPQDMTQWAPGEAARAGGEPSSHIKQALIREASMFIGRLGGASPDDGIEDAFYAVPRRLDERLQQMEEGLAQLIRQLGDAGLFRGRSGIIAAALDGLDTLSPREYEILQALLANQRVPTIARALCLSQHTVRNHLKSIFQKLDVHSQAELLERLQV